MPATLTLGALRALVREAEEAEADVSDWENRVARHCTEANVAGLDAARAIAETLNNTVVN